MHQGRPDSIPDWFLAPYHQDLCLIFTPPLMSPQVQQSSFPGIFPGTSRGSIGLSCAYAQVGRSGESLSHCHISICDSERVAQWGKSDFCPQGTRASPSSSFPQIPQKEYLGSWDRSHQRASSGLLRASTTKRRRPLHFQSDQILQFLICVFTNLMFTRSAAIHIDWRHSHDKDSLSGGWPLRQPREWPLA